MQRSVLLESGEVSVGEVVTGGKTGMAETVCPDGRNWNGHFQDRGQRPRQTRSSGVHSTLLGRRNRLKVAGLGVPSGLAQGATSTRSLKHSSAVAGGLRHHTYVAGASSRQGRGGVELQVPSRLRHGVSPYRLLARRKLRQGASSIARHRQPLHLQRQLPRQANDRPIVHLAP